MGDFIDDGHCYQAHHSFIRKAMGLAPKAKLPPEGIAGRYIQGWWVFCQPLQDKGKRRHRMLAVCPKCNALVSAGRTRQHAKAHR